MDRSVPSPAEFGLTPREIEQIERLQRTAEDGEAGFSWMENPLPKSELRGAVLLWTVLWPFFLVGLFATPIVQFVARMRLRQHAKYAAFRTYRDARVQHEKAKRDFWFGLSGTAFEHHLADLYARQGYSVALTKTSGDEGIDIVLTRDGKRTIVQCKQHSKPVGPAIARELYGALVASRAHSAILACTSGFTVGVLDFVRDKPIELIDVDAIVRMQERVNSQRSLDRPRMNGDPTSREPG